MLCMLIVLVYVVCVYVGVELMVSTYLYLPYLPHSFIQFYNNTFPTCPYIPKNIIIETNYQLTNSLPYIVLINICLTLLGYFPGHIHA